MPNSVLSSSYTGPLLSASSHLPSIAIVGRPNVGKSTLLNRLVGHRQTIVDDQPGVTRDCSFHPVKWRGQSFQLVDTGGIHWEPDDPFSPLINDQVRHLLKQVDAIVLLVDAQTGLTDLDSEVAKWVRQAEKPTLVVVNKVDRALDAVQATEFYALGLGDPLAISALHGSTSVGDVLDWMSQQAKARHRKPTAQERDNPPIRLTLAGRPNVGKSSLLNAILGHQRTIVSDIAGTTRDAIDVPFTYEDQPFILVDTAGIRRKTKVDYGIELFSVDRAVRSIRKADVCVLVLDAVEGITEQDKRIAQKVVDAGVGLVVVVNKWDLVPDKDTHSTARYQQQLLREVPSLGFAELVFTSAKSGQRVHKVLSKAKQARDNSLRRLPTHLVNEVFQEAFTATAPPTVKNKKLKLLYATQVKAGPPTFVLFVNDGGLMKDSYRRYLERHLRQRVELTGTPVTFILRNRQERTVSPGARRKR